MGRGSALLALVVWVAGACQAYGQSRLVIDQKLGTADGWIVGFNSQLGGCLATQTYSDQTTFWFGVDGRDRNRFYVALTNPNWQSIEPGKEYTLRLATLGGARWQGKFVGVRQQLDKGVLADGLKDKFVLDLVRSTGVAVSLGGKAVARLSLQGSPAAIKAILDCQSTKTGRTPSPGGSHAVSSGTGFFISTKGHVLTNNHVVAGCSTVAVEQPGQKMQTGRVLATDKRNDLALIATSIQPAAVASIRSGVRLGENIAVFGFPLSNSLASTGNFTVGYVSALAGLADDSSQIQISAPIQPGNSGGPVFDKHGNVVAVIVATATPAIMANASGVMPQNVNFAIKSAVARTFLDSNGINPDAQVGDKELDSADLAEQAKAKTVRVICNQ